MSLSLKSLVQNSKLLTSFLKPVAKAYAGAAGYRQIGKKKKQQYYKIYVNTRILFIYLFIQKKVSVMMIYLLKRAS